MKFKLKSDKFEVLGLPIVSVGLTAALPTLLQFAVKILVGTASDKITSLSETIKVNFNFFDEIKHYNVTCTRCYLSLNSFIK